MLLIQPETQAKSWPTEVAVHYFRQWLSELLTKGRGSKLGPGYAFLYRAISTRAKGTKILTNKQDVVDFLDRIYESPRANPSLMGALLIDVYKKAQTIVAPLLEDVTRRQDKTIDSYRALTFMSVDEDEIPWVQSK